MGEWSLDWLEELSQGAKIACLRNLTVVVMAGSLSASRVLAIRSSWARPFVDLLPERLFLMSDRQHAATGERTTSVLRGRSSKLDAPSRLIEGLRLAYETEVVRASSQWVLCVDDDSFVNLPHLLLLAGRFNTRVKTKKP